MTTLIEIAVYAVVLSGGGPLICTAQDHARVTCSNGLRAELAAPDSVRFSDGILVDRDSNGFPRFSDGTRSRWDRGGWLEFSNGVEVKRVTQDRFAFDSGLECQAKLPALVDCGWHAPG